MLTLCILATTFFTSLSVKEEPFIADAHFLSPFYKELNALAIHREGRLSILHIGDSHIQGGHFTGSIRQKLQQHFGNAGRGFVFPHKLANSYGAPDIQFLSTCNWQHTSVMKCDDCDIGLAGFKIYTEDAANLVFTAPNDVFNTVELFGRFDTLYTDSLAEIQTQSYGCTIKLNSASSRLSINPSLNKPSTGRLDGLVLLNNQPGVVYHEVGVSGSGVKQYLRSKAIREFLEVLDPDLVILSFGTNDSYVYPKSFCKDCIKEDYKQLINRIRAVKPAASILLTTPPDHYWRRKYPNPNVQKMNTIIFEIGQEEQCAVWDLYSKMGGRGAMKTWQGSGFASRDLIHFNKAGYAKLGEMFFNDLLGEFHRN